MLFAGLVEEEGSLIGNCSVEEQDATRDALSTKRANLNHHNCGSTGFGKPNVT